MESFIKGNIRKILFSSNASMYKVGLFKLRETNVDELSIYVGKTITFTGSISEINTELEYVLYGKMVDHPRYGFQFNASSYEALAPSDKDGIVMYLSSDMFKGIGEKTAKNIVDTLGEDAIKKIKEDYTCLLSVKSMNEKKAKNLYERLIEFEGDQEFVLRLNTLGLSTEEALKVIAKHKVRLFEILEHNIYELEGIVPFLKLDSIFLINNPENSDVRIKALIKYTIKTLCFQTGDTMVSNEKVYIYLNKFFKESLDLNSFYFCKVKLLESKEIIEKNNFLMLYNFYECEKYISEKISYLNKIRADYKDDEILKYIDSYEEIYNMKFNIDQKEAIKNSIINNLFIISGGPGTGKTTIIKSVVEILKTIDNTITNESFALLAPTGRSAKRLSESVHIPAYTIHKFLKWNKEIESFNLNEENKAKEKIIIIDEVSMVDIFLFSSLLKALTNNVKLILVGDANQLPSIAPGNVLFDLLKSEKINKKYLNMIYRTKEGSYIIDFALKIKNQETFETIENHKDFSFIHSSDENIKKYIKEVCNKIIKNNIDIDNFQVLAPMYKGENGIDNLNIIMQGIFNAPSIDKKEIKVGEKIYRVNDKVIELVNDVENNIFNGDIGYIYDIRYIDKKPVIDIDFMGNIITFNSNEFDKFSHAYAISIHKSQGSEYDHALIVLSSGFKRMFYNKLIYTAVTRAKKSLILIGTIDSLNSCIKTTYASQRITYLSELIN
ncbi:MAG: ATP-dependent RecD-like DNA helicase [Bacilli bacterium]|nr:ATP-dependent RecD-like DNA helicase [Bacilli bacterium]